MSSVQRLNPKFHDVWDKSTVCSCWQLTHAAVPILLKSTADRVRLHLLPRNSSQADFRSAWESLAVHSLKHTASAVLGGQVHCQGTASLVFAQGSNTPRILAVRGNHCAQGSAAVESTMQQADCRVWWMDHLQLSTASPRRFSYNPHFFSQCGKTMVTMQVRSIAMLQRCTGHKQKRKSRNPSSSCLSDGIEPKLGNVLHTAAKAPSKKQFGWRQVASLGLHPCAGPGSNWWELRFPLGILHCHSLPPAC